MLVHKLSCIEVIQVDPRVRPVRCLLDVARPEQNAWYPRGVHEEAGVTRRSPCRDATGKARLAHRGGHQPHELVVLRYLEGQIVRARVDLGLKPWSRCRVLAMAASSSSTTCSAVSPGLRRRSTSISQRSGTTYGRVPPRIVPTVRLGGPNRAWGWRASSASIDSSSSAIRAAAVIALRPNPGDEA